VGTCPPATLQPCNPATFEEIETKDDDRVRALERELLRAARAGDRAAYGDLYERYAPMVHGVLVARVAPAEADDLLQDVFIRAMTELRHLRDDDHFGGWIAAIARNRAADWYRRSYETTGSEEALHSVSTPETASKRADAHAALEAIQSLPAAYHETLALRLVEGMTGPEIAERTGLTPGSVRVNLHRGMALLREALAARGGHRGGEA
jgi:RNA polymerase sigma-70 factor (ECF subfamily)